MARRRVGSEIGLFLLAALVSASALTAQTQAPSPSSTPSQRPVSVLNIRGEVRFFALRWRQEGDWIYADGETEVHYKNMALWADHLEINLATKDVLAVGSVLLHIYKPATAAFSGGLPPARTDQERPAAPAKPVAPAQPPASTAPATSEAPLQPDQVIHADRLELNMDTVEGRLSKVSALIQPTLALAADTFERKDGIDHMARMSFTTCTQPVPRWKFSCAKADLKQDDYVAMWGAVFSIKKLPVFYWPYMRYPLDETRSTGFLMPEIGYSGTKGVFLSQAFFWALARSQDLTLQLDAYSERGLGGGAEWRYLFGGGTAGKLNLFYFKFKSQEAASSSSSSGGGETDAYIIRWNHNQALPGGFTLAAAVDYQSSFDFLREFDNNFQSATVSNRRSQVYVSKSWSKLSLNVRASQFETYFPQYENGTSIVTRYLPQISLSSYKLKLAGPLYLSFGGGFSRWQYGWQSDYDADRELRLQTASFVPVISLPWSALPWLSANFSLTGNAYYYWQTYRTDAEAGTRSVVDEPMLALTYGAAGEVIGPSFFKIYDLKSGQRIKHLIEPTLTYRYDSPLADRDKIVTAAGYFLYHQLSYGVTNHVYIKDAAPAEEKGAAAQRGGLSGGPARKILTWGLSQTFYLAPETGPLSYYLVDGKAPEFSEITTYLRFFPGVSYSLDVSAAYNPYYKTVSSLRMGATVGRPTDNWFLNVSWFKSINAWLKGASEAGLPGTTSGGGSYMLLEYSSLWDRHQLNVYGGFKIPKWELEGRGEAAFNFIERKLLYTAWDLVYHYQCLDFKAQVRMFYYRETPEFRINFSVGIGNIGRTGDFLGGI